MVTVPGFLLRRLYVKTSLRNTDNGFAFDLRNGLGSGYAHKLCPIKVDGEEVPLESTYFTMDGASTFFSQVSEQKVFALPMNKTITVCVDAVSLEQGPRRIDMGFDVPGMGTLKFDFTDLPSNA